MTVRFEQPKMSPVQRLAADRQAGQAGRKSGVGTRTNITVKGQPADAAQLATINGVLQEAQNLGASTLVMVACIMCITQENDAYSSTNDGPFAQEVQYYGSIDRHDPAASCKAFLEGLPGVIGWKQKFGSLKNAPGDLGADVQDIQRAGAGNLYSQWQPEATRTVAAIMNGGGPSGTSPSSTRTSSNDSTTTKTKVEPYEFTRGQNGQLENSWDCSGRLGQEVNFFRWAELNTLFFVSDNELRAAAPSLKITGTEAFLRRPPGYELAPRRAANQMTLEVWAALWGCQIGAAVELDRGHATDGVWLVAETHGTWASPELTVVLERPAPKLKEPAADTTTSTSSSDDDTSSTSVNAATGKLGKLLAACKLIDSQNVPYKYGGGHSAPLAQLVKAPTSDQGGLDCSSSTSLALYEAGMFPHSTAFDSTAFMTEWGEPGEGKHFTVWATNGHVFIAFKGVAGISQFNTYPGGGPQIRTSPTSDPAGRTPRHWPGL